MMQEIAAFALVGLAAGWLIVRYFRRRATGNCCGESECPAAKATAKRLEDALRRR